MMSDTPEELYEKYLYNNTADDIAYEVVTITHSQMSQDYNITQERDGVTATFEDGTETFCEGMNFAISRESTSNDLDVEFSFVFSDIFGKLRAEADLIDLTTDEPIILEYRVFMKSDTSTPAYGPIKLYGDSMTATTNQQVTIMASSPSLVVNRCGELYTYERFPMLKAYL